MVATYILRAVIYVILQITWVCYIPLDIIRLFYKKKICPPITNELLLLSASEVAEKIRKREVSSETIVRSYIERISEVNPLLNAVIDERFDEALEESKHVENILNSVSMKELKDNYPLLGVPFTVKGSLAVEGLDHSAGVKLKQKIALKNATAVQKLMDAGAIPLLVSNTPEFCLNWETTNKLIGRTNNPYDLRRTVGGSTGGEAALLSAAASLIGIGSDVAGSLRIPMHYCGVWGHKPSPRLISLDGHYPKCPEEEWPDVFQVGPVSRYASDLSTIFELMVEPNMKSRLKQPVDLRKLKVYYLKEIRNPLVSRANADTKRAVEKVVNYFNNYTEKSVAEEINSDMLKFASEYSYFRLLLVDNVDNLFEGKGEGAHMELLRFLFCMSQSVFTTIGYGLLRWWTSTFPEYYKKKTLDDLDALKKEMLELLNDQSVLIMPTFTKEAAFHGDVLKRLFDYGYCGIFNALGLPSTDCPVMQTEEGLPIGIQVIGAPYCDRLCLAVAKEIEKAFGGWKPPSSNDN
ncbi:fatty-acid amide hydrolase 2-like [Coccinella septempunctata]|uniref:fatty-acid amide hydrolase 2-like n=1 Tax=Coccinella septempunctata TaxID=41139 RepID=UPI001D089E22|nr:fatty-acid amide hydrolase 2-like [Coccinella septempunctata]XP_044757516.1 fatty-acid amide hydrolase 2-like [Coccinella septempunctata]XP_044757517.1 fatty-acid amide hydrolase 2-like [Coccinella septempunctata]